MPARVELGVDMPLSLMIRAEAQRVLVGNGHTRVAAMRLLTCGSLSTLQTIRRPAPLTVGQLATRKRACAGRAFVLEHAVGLAT